MVYLVLDTNIWIYLANGVDPAQGQNSDTFHFELLQKLNDFTDQDDITIIINDVIVTEWERRRVNAELKLSKLNNKKKEIYNQIKDIEKYTGYDLKKIYEKYIDAINTEIQKNLTHIGKVDTFIQSKCKRIRTPQSVKEKIFDLSINKRAPYHNSKDNNADASILFTANDYLRNHLGENDKAIFVSNNFTDFSDGKSSEKFHPDIINQLDVSLEYNRHLHIALASSEKYISEEYSKLLNQELDYHLCQSSFCRYRQETRGYVDLDTIIDVEYEDKALYNDPNQLSLFPAYFPSHVNIQVNETKAGRCVVCHTLHVICPECEELTVVTAADYELFHCEICQNELIIDGTSILVKAQIENDEVMNN